MGFGKELKVEISTLSMSEREGMATVRHHVAHFRFPLDLSWDLLYFGGGGVICNTLLMM